VCPTIAQQQNGFDCSLYCCPFSYGLLRVVQHGSPFISKGMYMERSPLYSKITHNPMFSFTPDLVYTFWTQLRQLIVRLSRIWQYQKSHPFVESLSTETPEKSKDSLENSMLSPGSLQCTWDYTKSSRPLLQFLSTNMTENSTDDGEETTRSNSSVPLEDNPSEEESNNSDSFQERPSEDLTNSSYPLEDKPLEEEPSSSVPLEDKPSEEEQAVQVDVRFEEEFGIYHEQHSELSVRGE
jgi:hypothetical protein